MGDHPDTIPGKVKEIVPITNNKSSHNMRYTWHVKARMIFWLAEALYITKIAQDEIDKSPQEVSDLLRQANLVEESEALVASGLSGILDD